MSLEKYLRLNGLVPCSIAQVAIDQHPYCLQATMGLNNMDYLCVNFYTLMHSNDMISLPCRFPLKAVKVMHTVALRTEATISGGEMPANLGQAFKVILCKFHIF